MEVKRDRYLQQLIDRQWNGLIKVIQEFAMVGNHLRESIQEYLLSHG